MAKIKKTTRQRVDPENSSHECRNREEKSTGDRIFNRCLADLRSYKVRPFRSSVSGDIFRPIEHVPWQVGAGDLEIGEDMQSSWF